MGMQCDTGANITTGFNAGNPERTFLWSILSGPYGKELGLACNRIPSANGYISTSTQGSAFAMLGYYSTGRTGTAFSFTGEHSSMVCDEEYSDIMDTDACIGMIVCSSGKIYNLPYDVDGNTYAKQADNIN
jgi:hypothetical protein